MEQVVDTTALGALAKAVFDLSDYVTTARDEAIGIRVQPGSFNEANMLRAKVEESTRAFDLALTKLRDVLEETAEGVQQARGILEEAEASNTRVARTTPFENPFADAWQELGGGTPVQPAVPSGTPPPQPTGGTN